MSGTLADQGTPVRRLLGPDDPTPFEVRRADGASPFLIVCDHAGRDIPQALGDLGLSQEVRDQHIGWDIGAADVAERLGAALGACTIRQAYSRLVIDCNRPPSHPQAVIAVSDGVVIPANAGLHPDEVAKRVQEIHAAYHAQIDSLLDERAARGQRTLMISVHSFTPQMAGFARPWIYGVLHDGASPFSHAVLALLQGQSGVVVGDNEPYQLEPMVDYTVPHHAQPRGLDYLELEIRQDTIASAQGAQAAADLLASLLPKALDAAG